MKSTLFNMVAVLFSITLIASAGVGAVNMITADAIAEANALATKQAVENVLPQFESNETDDMVIDDMAIKIYTAKSGEDIVGYAVESMTKNGFGGVIRLMVGFSPEGKILNVNVLSQAETPGLGTKMCDEGNALISSIQDKDPDDMSFSVKKDGGELDALTAATISSRAYYEAVERANEAFEVVSGAKSAPDSVSGATSTNDNQEGAEAQEGGNNE
ncbi:MAG: RnfABCDGE type electron transport complex subunit G [Alistipes sp.]|nr:RnfABCDGE type electron transport complex subunit G [Alistipes sp.]